MREIVEAEPISNPIFLSKHLDEDIMSALSFPANKLSTFGYSHFNERFIDKLKEEMPKVTVSERRKHNLDKFKLSERYKTRLQRRIKELNIIDSDID